MIGAGEGTTPTGVPARGNPRRPLVCGAREADTYTNARSSPASTTESSNGNCRDGSRCAGDDGRGDVGGAGSDRGDGPDGAVGDAAAGVEGPCRRRRGRRGSSRHARRRSAFACRPRAARAIRCMDLPAGCPVDARCLRSCSFALRDADRAIARSPASCLLSEGSAIRSVTIVSAARRIVA